MSQAAEDDRPTWGYPQDVGTHTHTHKTSLLGDLSWSDHLAWGHLEVLGPLSTMLARLEQGCQENTRSLASWSQATHWSENSESSKTTGSLAVSLNYKKMDTWTSWQFTFIKKTGSAGNCHSCCCQTLLEKRTDLFWSPVQTMFNISKAYHISKYAGLFVSHPSLSLCDWI